jgi:hypothetical protein
MGNENGSLKRPVLGVPTGCARSNSPASRGQAGAVARHTAKEAIHQRVLLAHIMAERQQK